MSTSALRVVSLQAQNVMRLAAVEIAWAADKSTLTIGGKNGAGKSSVLNAVAMALGGAALCPDEPIRRGESEGFVEVNLGELVVRREFSREKITRPVEGQDQQAFIGWSETKSRISVKNADGIRLGTPQSILDKLIGKLSFDPLAFAAMGNEGAEGEKRQAAILRQVVGLDTTDIDAKRAAAFQRRAALNKQLKDGEAVVAAMVSYPDAPAEETPMDAIGAEMLKAEEHRKLADEAERAVSTCEARIASLETQCQTRYARIEELHRQIASIQEELVPLEQNFTAEGKNLDALKITAEAARAVVPDVSAIRQKLANAEATNVKVRANKAKAIEVKRLEGIEQQAKAEDAEVKRLEREKEEALRAVKFPVEGLGVGDGGVTFNGIPFKQASTAEQMRVSVAVGFALNPGLKLLLVRNGNALDEDSMKLVAEQAEKAGGQILMEYVTKDASEVSVMIEDGHVA